MDAPLEALERRPRAWGPAALAAALIMYLPHLLPMLIGHMGSCSSCRTTWYEHFVWLPGLLFSVWLLFLIDIQRGAERNAIAILLCILILAALTSCLTRGPRVRLGVGLVALRWFCLNAMALDAAFAM